jgi:hypothetical protein
MDIPNHAELIDSIERFCTRHDMAETRFGREAVSNPNFISGLRKDPPVSPTLKTLNEVKAYMERTDAEAATRAKLDAPLEPVAGGEADSELPFATAPVNPTGASSPTSSPTSARPTPREANGSCPSCSSPDGESLVAGPSKPTEAGAVAGPANFPTGAGE